MIIVLNGARGIGKSTLPEALSESIQKCVMLSGDLLIAAHPPWIDELGNSQAAPDNSGAGQGVVPLLGQPFFRTSGCITPLPSPGFVNR